AGIDTRGNAGDAGPAARLTWGRPSAMLASSRPGPRRPRVHENDDSTMPVQYWWWLLSLGLGILELVTGTFYLLVVAVGCAAGGAVAAMGLPAWAQFVAAAIVSVAGAGWVRKLRGSTQSRPAA